MALKGIRVVELAGLAPGPFCGLILSDFGASVIRVDRVSSGMDVDVLANGKQSVALNLKDKKGIDIFRRICRKSDVLLDTYRAGVMETLGLGPNVLLAENPKLIYARLSGYGQQGLYAKKAGHDINYLALTGLLSILSQKNERPQPPLNLLADFGGGGLMCALGIVMALYERTHSGKGQIIDANMVEGTAYLGSWIYRSQTLPIWTEDSSVLKDTQFYRTYETKDGKYMAVGAIEPKFYESLLKGLGLTEHECPQYDEEKIVQNIFAKKFLEKTQEEWCKIFDNIDACVTPVLDFKQAPRHPHNAERNTFSEQECLIPTPAPRLSRTPAESHAMKPKLEVGQHTEIILKSVGYSEKEIDKFETDGIIGRVRRSKI